METIANLIIRPSRSLYDPSRDLGPSLFTVKGVPCRRKDLQILNDRSQTLQCSWFEPISSKPYPRPCVIYCHGNCGNRVDSVEILEAVLSARMSVFAFDFAGSGLSDGKFVSLGVYEQSDIHSVVTFLSASGLVTSLALWGRSMGAVAAILYASSHCSVSALVLDSPFSAFRAVVEDIAAGYKLIPEVITTFFLEKIRQHVQKTASFDMFSINPIENVQRCDMPGLFIHAKSDRLIGLKHAEALFAAYPHQEKELRKVNGTHNSTRPKAAYTDAAQFLRRHLSCSRRRLATDDWDGLQTQRTPLPSMLRRVRDRIKATQATGSPR